MEKFGNEAQGWFTDILKSQAEGKDQTNDVYVKWASGYDAAMDDIGFNLHGRVADLAKSYLVKDGKSVANAAVFDIGCGTGRAAKALVNVGFKLIDGSDAVEEMLDVAKGLCMYKDLHQAMITDSPMAEGKKDHYDLVTAMAVISVSHAKLTNALRDMLALLKAGGIAIYTISDTISTAEALRGHVPFLEENKCQLVSIVRTFYYAWVNGDEYCHLAIVRKL